MVRSVANCRRHSITIAAAASGAASADSETPASGVLVRRAVAAHVRPGARDQIAFGIKDGVAAGKTGADLQHPRFAGRPVLQTMAVLVAGLEPGTVAGLQNFLAIIGDQH